MSNADKRRKDSDVQDVSAEPKNQPKRNKQEEQVYWFWCKDGRSYTKAYLQEYLEQISKTTNLEKESITSPNGAFIKYAWCFSRELEKLGASVCDWFVQDKSRGAGDEICSITHETLCESQPHLLNLTGRSYSLDGILQALDQLKRGMPLRLEDTTIEPEQLQEIVLYPNQSLGADGTEPITFTDAKIPIRPFDSSAKLESMPKFWADVLVPDGNGIWSMESAAKKHGFCTQQTYHIVVKNQLVESIQVPHPHPKMNSGTLVLRNCLFRNCIVLIGCWCGPNFHGCLFENCTFVFISTPSHVKTKQCRINGGSFHAKVPSICSQWTRRDMHTWLKVYLGQAGFDMAE